MGGGGGKVGGGGGKVGGGGGKVGGGGGKVGGGGYLLYKIIILSVSMCMICLTCVAIVQQV